MKKNIFDLNDKEIAQLDKKFFKTELGRQQLIKFEYLTLIGIIPLFMTTIKIIFNIIDSIRNGVAFASPNMTVPLIFFLAVFVYAFADFAGVSRLEEKYFELELARQEEENKPKYKKPTPRKKPTKKVASKKN